MVDWANLYGAPPESEYKDIAVFVGAADAGKRVVGKSRELADALGCYVRLHGGGPGWGPVGADRILSGSIVDALNQKPEIVLFAPETALLEPILRWAQKNGLPVIGPCLDVSVDLSTREAAGRRTIFAGAMIADIVTGGRRPQIFALDPAHLPEPLLNPSRIAV